MSFGAACPIQNNRDSWLFIDIAGVLLILFGLLIASARYLIAFRSVRESNKLYRQDIGRAILLGLEVAVRRKDAHAYDH